MIRVYQFRHPLSSEPPAVHEAASIGEWLLDFYGTQPSNRIQVFRGESPSAASEITGNVEALIANDEEVYTVLESPAGIDPFSWAIFAIAVVLAVVAVALAPKPGMPSNVNRSQESPNNSLSDRNNKLRMLERVEDIFGTVRAIPSLMMQTYYKYIGNRQFEFGYYCISRGYIDASDIRDAETLISDIDGASAAVYYPFTSPNSPDGPVIQIGPPIIDKIITARRAEEVDGITLKAPNQVQIPNGLLYDFGFNGSNNFISQHTPKPNFNAVAEVGTDISVSMTPLVTTTGTTTASASLNTFTSANIQDFAEIGWTVTTTGFVNAANNVTRTVTSVGSGSFTVNGAALVTETSVPGVVFTFTSPNYSGNYEVIGVDNGIVYINGAPFSVNLSSVTANVFIDGGTEWSPWVTLPDVARQEVIVNILATNGMYADDGGGKTFTAVSFQLQIEKLDANLVPTGVVETVTGGVGGSTQDEVAETLEHVTAFTGPARVRMRRSSDFNFDFQGTIVDEIKWNDLYSVTPVIPQHFGNKTTIHTVTRATERATSLRSRQLNCLASRMLPAYNGEEFSGGFDENGKIAWGTITPTSQITDIMAAVSQDPMIGRQNLEENIDIDQILDANIAANQMHPEAGQFNFTFDSDTMSFEETVVTIANAAFCTAYRQNGKIRFAFDQAQPSSTALFTHRNKRPGSDTITRNFSSDSQYDGVEFVYVDPDTETNETIILPLSGDYTKLKKFEIPGIRSFAQAWLRANREYYKLLGQRITIETELTQEARALLPNARVDIVDNTKIRAFDGEVVRQQGLEIFLSRDVEFTPDANHSVVLNHRDGTPESIYVLPGSQANSVILQSLPSEEIVTQYGPDGIRTVFSFADDGDREAMAYLVQEIDQSDQQYAKIRAINYSPDYYQMDTQPIPARDSVISNS